MRIFQDKGYKSDFSKKKYLEKNVFDAFR